MYFEYPNTGPDIFLQECIFLLHVHTQSSPSPSWMILPSVLFVLLKCLSHWIAAWLSERATIHEGWLQRSLVFKNHTAWALCDRAPSFSAPAAGFDSLRHAAGWATTDVCQSSCCRWRPVQKTTAPTYDGVLINFTTMTTKYTRSTKIPFSEGKKIVSPPPIHWDAHEKGDNSSWLRSRDTQRWSGCRPMPIEREMPLAVGLAYPTPFINGAPAKVLVCMTTLSCTVHLRPYTHHFPSLGYPGGYRIQASAPVNKYKEGVNPRHLLVTDA